MNYTQSLSLETVYYAILLWKHPGRRIQRGGVTHCHCGLDGATGESLCCASPHPPSLQTGAHILTREDRKSANFVLSPDRRGDYFFRQLSGAAAPSGIQPLARHFPMSQQSQAGSSRWVL